MAGLYTDPESANAGVDGRGVRVTCIKGQHSARGGTCEVMEAQRAMCCAMRHSTSFSVRYTAPVPYRT